MSKECYMEICYCFGIDFIKEIAGDVVIRLLIVTVPLTITSVSCYTAKVNCRHFLLIFICCVFVIFYFCATI